VPLQTGDIILMDLELLFRATRSIRWNEKSGKAPKAITREIFFGRINVLDF
tara:strand:- start:382 stop:534 length:153 start_codon:yes stop_codon:yes gene_type:complete